MIVFCQLDTVGKGYSDRKLHLVFRLVLSVLAPSFRLPELYLCERLFLAENLLYIIGDPFGVEVFLGFKAALGLVAKFENQSAVDHCLLFQGILEKFRRDIDVGKHL